MRSFSMQSHSVRQISRVPMGSWSGTRTPLCLCKSGGKPIYAHAPQSARNRPLHLDDSVLANGPLRVLPGTHNAGVLGDDEIHRFGRPIAAVDCLVRRGGNSRDETFDRSCLIAVEI